MTERRREVSHDDYQARAVRLRCPECGAERDVTHPPADHAHWRCIQCVRRALAATTGHPPREDYDPTLGDA
jgi:ribosomal protein S27E